MKNDVESRIHPITSNEGPEGGNGKALAVSGERHALPPGKGPGTHGRGWVSPTTKNNVHLIKNGTGRCKKEAVIPITASSYAVYI